MACLVLAPLNARFTAPARVSAINARSSRARTWCARRRRPFRWREMLENGTHATITEIAATEKINESYVWVEIIRPHLEGE